MPENPIALEISAEVAQASYEANWLLWTIMGGFLLIFAFWALIKWRLDRERYHRNRASALRTETDRNERQAAQYWDEFCRRNDLPESTRNVLCAKRRAL